MLRFVFLGFLCTVSLSACKTPIESTSDQDSTAVDTLTVPGNIYDLADGVGDGGGDQTGPTLNYADWTFTRYTTSGYSHAIVSPFKNGFPQPIILYTEDFRELARVDTGFVVPTGQYSPLQMSKPDACQSEGLWVEIPFRGSTARVILHPLSSNEGNSGVVLDLQTNPFVSTPIWCRGQELTIGYGYETRIVNVNIECINYREVFFYNDEKVYRIYASSELGNKDGFYSEGTGLFVEYQDRIDPTLSSDGQTIFIEKNTSKLSLTIEDGILTVVEDREPGSTEFMVDLSKGRTQVCTFTAVYPGDCTSMTFSCGDLGGARMQLKESELAVWDDLVVATARGLQANPKMVGKKFQITFDTEEGWPCQDAYPDTTAMYRGTIPVITSFKLVE